VVRSDADASRYARHKSKSISRLLAAPSGDYAALNWHLDEAEWALDAAIQSREFCRQADIRPSSFFHARWGVSREQTEQNGARCEAPTSRYSRVTTARGSSFSRTNEPMRRAFIQLWKTRTACFPRNFIPRGREYFPTRYFPYAEENLSIAPLASVAVPPPRGAIVRDIYDKTNHCNNEPRWLLKKEEKRERYSLERYSKCNALEIITTVICKGIIMKKYKFSYFAHRAG